MTALRKLAGQTAIYGLICFLSLCEGCGSADDDAVVGTWRGHMVHGMGERTITFADDGACLVDDTLFGSYTVLQDTLVFENIDGTTVRGTLTWSDANSFRLIFDGSFYSFARTTP